MIVWDHWHIEPSSICTLKCPRCPRAEVPDSLLNRQLTLEFFKKQIGFEAAQKIKKITFCGNDGDPIYCRELMEICMWLKTANPEMHIVIITNGSYRQPEWWQALGRVLDWRDEIHWSVDGWDQASNEQYRVNCDWASIIAGMQAFQSVNRDTYRVWATIAFSFNQDYLEDIRDLAYNFEFDAWQLTKSTKFGSHYPDTYGVNDPLCPTDSSLVAQGHRFQREVHDLTDRARPGSLLKEIFWSRAQDIIKHNQHPALCSVGNKGVFLNSRGEFYPCCWTANRYPHNEKWQELGQTRFNLSQRTLAQIQQDTFWHREFLEFDSLECQTKCTADRLKDRDHATEW